MTIDTKELRKVIADCYWPTSPVAINKLLDRLEAAEKTNREWLRANAPGGWIDNLRVENEALRAKVEQMERQEPVTAQQRFQRQQEMMAVWLPWQTTELRKGRPARTVDVLGLNVEYRELYALPGAQNVESSQDEWKTLAKDLLREIERQTCAHEETHRGGFLWEICDSCGAKWADDEGGKPEFKWPKVVERAHAMLAAAPEAKP